MKNKIYRNCNYTAELNDTFLHIFLSFHSILLMYSTVVLYRPIPEDGHVVGRNTNAFIMCV